MLKVKTTTKFTLFIAEMLIRNKRLLGRTQYIHERVVNEPEPVHAQSAPNS